MSADRRTPRDERRRSLGQNFLRPDLADRLVAGAAFVPGDLVVEIGAGRGACTFALARHGVQVVALEKDPRWAQWLRREVARRGLGECVHVVCRDALDYQMPRRPFRAFGSLPFGATTSILRHLLDDPSSGLLRADLIVQREVAAQAVGDAADHAAVDDVGAVVVLRDGTPDPGFGLPPRARCRRRRAPGGQADPAPAPGAHGHRVRFFRATRMEVAFAAHMQEDAWTVPDVYLLTEGAEGEVAVPNLALTFDVDGVELEKSDGETVWDRPWVELDEMSPVERSVLPDGRDGVVILVVERGGRRRHRFVLSSDDAELTETSIRERADAHGLRTSTPQAAVSRVLIVAIGLALGATLTVLLLSAAHVFQF